MNITLTRPLIIDDEVIKEINCDLEGLSGADILKVDMELRVEGHPRGMADVFDQNVLIKFASKSSGIKTDDLTRLNAVDFLELTFSVRNFLLGLSGQKETQQNSEESSSN